MFLRFSQWFSNQIVDSSFRSGGPWAESTADPSSLEYHTIFQPRSAVEALDSGKTYRGRYVQTCGESCLI